MSGPEHERQQEHQHLQLPNERGSEVSGRVSDRVNSSPENDLLRGATRGETRDDSSPNNAAARRPDPATHSSPQPSAPARIAHLARQLTDVDWSIVETLATVRMASGIQLQRLYYPPGPSGARQARRRVARLTDLRVLARLDRQIGGVRGGSQGHTYALDTNGQRLAQSRHLQTIRRPTPSDTFVDHTIAVTEIYVTLQEYRQVEVQAFEGEPDCWRRLAGRAGRELTLRPDAFAHWFVQEWELLAFFEVDRATEHPGRITRKAEQYVHYWRTGIEQDAAGVFPSVVWITPNERRAEVVAVALDRLEDGRQLFEVITDDDLPSFITSNEENERNEINDTTRGGDP